MTPLVSSPTLISSLTPISSPTLISSRTPISSQTPRPNSPSASHARLARRRARGVWSLAAGLVAGAVALLLAGSAGAHGPTIEISHSEMKPPLLNLHTGTTVHFANTVAMPGGHVVVDEAGELESPPLAKPGDGWHYTFEKAGTYEVFVKQHPKAKARIVVIDKP